MTRSLSIAGGLALAAGITLVWSCDGAPGGYEDYELRGEMGDATGTIVIKKFHDANANGEHDEGEQYVYDWLMHVTDPWGMITDHETTATIPGLEPGAYMVDEHHYAETINTATFVNGMPYPTGEPVSVYVEPYGLYVVKYGNVGLGRVIACKVHDANGNGVADEGEPLVSEWPITLMGTDMQGNAVGPIDAVTGEDGCVVFDGLYPGEYEVTEGLLSGWTSTGDTTQTALIVSTSDGTTIMGNEVVLTFTNVCTPDVANPNTPGYWQSPNGQAEITPGVLLFINSLLPFAAPSEYCGCEPFADAEAMGTFLTAAIKGNMQHNLARHLLAFVCNVLLRFGGTEAVITLPDGATATGAQIIEAAVEAWQSGDHAAQEAMKDLLDEINNSDAVQFTGPVPCPVSPE